MAEPFHCDFSGRLFLGHLGNNMLNAADFHSTDRGFGMRYLMSIQRSWVLSRLAIEMEDIPKQYDRFCIETWDTLPTETSASSAATGVSLAMAGRSGL